MKLKNNHSVFVLLVLFFAIGFYSPQLKAWMGTGMFWKRGQFLFAGNYKSEGITDGTGRFARFNKPMQMTKDSSGNIFIADRSNHCIRKMTPAGVVTTIAGLCGTSGFVNGAGASARFDGPAGIAMDSMGNIYVSEIYNYLIRKIDTSNVVTTFAGKAGIAGNLDATGTAAEFTFLERMTIDSLDNIFVLDFNAIKKITPAAVVTTFAGNVSITGFINATGTSARFNFPAGIAINKSDNSLFVADPNNGAIRKITSGAVVTTFSTGYLFSGIGIDSSGKLLSGSNAVILQISTGGIVTELIGNYTEYGSLNGVGTLASNGVTLDFVFDNSDIPYVSDQTFNIIRKITGGNIINTIAGYSTSGVDDGLGSLARFNSPQFMVKDSSGNFYVTDNGSHTIRKITPRGLVSTFAGQPGVSGSANGTGSAATFNSPTGITIDSSGNLFVADSLNFVIRKITPAGVVTTFAGTVGASGNTNNTGAAARFSGLKGMVIDSSNVIYAIDSNAIRKITSGAVVTTFAGSTGSSGSTNNTGTLARFYIPTGLTIDPANNNLYVVDSYNQTIRKVTSAAVVTTIAGTPGVQGSNDGSGAAAQFYFPIGITFAKNNLYVTDRFNYILRKITLAGVTSTVSDSSAYSVQLGGMYAGVGPAFSVYYANNKLYIISSDCIVVKNLE